MSTMLIPNSGGFLRRQRLMTVVRLIWFGKLPKITARQSNTISGGALHRFDYNTAVLATTGSISHQVTGLTDGIPYYFGVRSRDAATNSDVNSYTKVCHAGNAFHEVEQFSYLYRRWSGRYADYSHLWYRLWLGEAGTTSSFPATFAVGSAYTADTKVTGNSFVIYVANGNGTGGQVTAELGYWNGSFQSFTSPVKTAVNLATRAQEGCYL